jgi:hypothetical protein
MGASDLCERMGSDRIEHRTLVDREDNGRKVMNSYQLKTGARVDVGEHLNITHG